MSQFYESMKDLFTSSMVDKAAAMVDEKPENVKKTISATISSLLAMYLKTRNPNVNNIIREAGNLNIIRNIGKVCDVNTDGNLREISDRFLQEMLGDRAADFTAPIAKMAGVSNVAANQLIYMAAPVVAGYLGDKLQKDKWDENKLQEEIRKSKGSFVGNIPVGIVNAFDLSYVIRTDTGGTGKKNNNWIWWIVALLAVLLLFFGWRSCKEKQVNEVALVPETEIVSEVDVVVSKFVDITLPDGVVLHVYRDGIEDRMIRFLNSDEYKNATENQLREKWFEFKDVSFKFDSVTEMSPEANKELDNIAAILRAYPDAKVRIAGFADKKGTKPVNLEISKERAIHVEKVLDGKGVGAQIVKAEGFGEEFAKHSVTETNEQRSEDRDIALRFTK